MALTVDNVEYSVFGNKAVVFCEIEFDSSYPTGGEELLPATVGMSQVDLAIISGKNGYLFEYDYSDNKVKALYPTSITSTSGTVNDSLGYGTGANAFITANGDHHGVEVGSEVGNTVDLSGITDVKVMLIGY